MANGTSTELDQAIELHKAGRTDEAATLLTKLLLRMPKGWKPLRGESTGDCRAFWSFEEFSMYVDHHKAELDGSDKLFLYDSVSYSKAFYLLACFALEAKEPVAALGWVNAGLKLEPDHPDLLSEKGLIVHTQGRHDEAVALYQQAATSRTWATSGQRARAMRGAAVVLIDEGRLDAAESYLRRSLEHEPQSQVALRELRYIEYLRSGGCPVSMEVRPS